MLDKWLHHDKVLHVMVSFFLVTAFSHLYSLWVSCMITLILGLLKEAVDAIDKRLDAYDMLANIAGTGLGYIFIKLFV